MIAAPLSGQWVKHPWKYPVRWHCIFHIPRCVSRVINFLQYWLQPEPGVISRSYWRSKVLLAQGNSMTVMPYVWHGISNHKQLTTVEQLIQDKNKNIKALHHRSFVKVIQLSTVVSPHKGISMQNVFPGYYIIMLFIIFNNAINVYPS